MSKPIKGDEKAKKINITTLYNFVEQKSISESTSNIEVAGLQQKTTLDSTPVHQEQ